MHQLRVAAITALGQASLHPSQLWAAPAPPADEAVTLFLQGFNATWASRPHRLHDLGFLLDPGHSHPAGPHADLWVHVRGGSWASGEAATDTPLVSLAYGGFASRQRVPTYGSAHMEIRGTAGRAPESRHAATGSQAVTVAVPGLVDGAAVWLRGFRVQTDALHPDGFTMHALSIELGPARVEQGQASFLCQVEIVGAAVPDRAQDLEEYGASVDIDYTVLPSAAEGVVRQHVSGRLSRGISLETETERVRPALMPFAFAVATEAPEVAAALSGFSVRLDEEGVDSGRYLRELGVTIEDLRFDPYRRRVDGVVSALFSNAGQVARPIAVDLGADITALTLLPGERSWSGRWESVLHDPDTHITWPDELPASANPALPQP